MSRTVLCGALTALICVQVAAQPTMSIKVTSGKALVWRKSEGGWVGVKDTGPVAQGDSIYLDNHEAATVSMGKETTIKLKGLCRVAIQGEGLDVNVDLVEGQLFLRRVKPYEYNTFTASAHKCRFVPLGTAGAIRFSKKGEPSLAMLEGKMRMEAPGGDAVLVEPGRFATYQRDKKIVRGKLSKSAVAALEQWSGLKYSGPPAPEEEEVTDPGGADAETAAPAAQVAAPPSAATPGVAKAQTPAGKPGVAKAQTPAGKPGDAAAPAGKGGETGDAQAESSEEPTGEAGGEPGEAAEAGDEAGDQGGTAEAGPWKPTWEIGAGVTTVDDEQWTLLSLGVDLPIWKFGIFFDLEFFINSEGKFSDKGWKFDEDNWHRSLLRKIRYIRFGREGDPFFFKFGGLGSVTMGYGFIVDRLTNMLHYPDEKLLGIQMELNDVSPIGVTFQGLIADLYDFKNEGGVMAARLGFKFFKATETPLVKDLLISAIYAIDRNLYAPARAWDYSLNGGRWDRDEDDVTDSTYIYSMFGDMPEYLAIVQRFVDSGDYDRRVEHEDQWAAREHSRFSLAGGDVGMPLINKKILRLDLYGQAASRVDKVTGWGFGAPGLALKAGPFWATVEYRHVKGRFEPGFFGPYYLDQRLQRNPIRTKVDSLPTVSLDGVFGLMGFNIADVLIMSGTYQYMGASSGSNRDQRYEATACIGNKVVEKIPKLTKAEIYVYKTNVAEKNVWEKTGTVWELTKDRFFEKTPYMYWGYRVGFEITKGAALTWDARHGYKYVGKIQDGSLKLVKDNTISVATAITF